MKVGISSLLPTSAGGMTFYRGIGNPMYLHSSPQSSGKNPYTFPQSAVGCRYSFPQTVVRFINSLLYAGIKYTWKNNSIHLDCYLLSMTQYTVLKYRMLSPVHKNKRNPSCVIFRSPWARGIYPPRLQAIDPP